MEKTQPTILSLEGDWEQICNNVERHNARVRLEEKLFQKQLKRENERLITLSLGAILSIGLGLVGFVIPWLSAAAAALLTATACIQYGRIYEKRGACR